MQKVIRNNFDMSLFVALKDKSTPKFCLGSYSIGMWWHMPRPFLTAFLLVKFSNLAFEHDGVVVVYFEYKWAKMQSFFRNSQVLTTYGNAVHEGVVFCA